MPSKIKTVLVWIAQILVGLLFVLISLPKLQSDPGWVERFSVWGIPAAKQMVMVTGILELVGGVGFLVPKATRYGGALLLLVMTGAFLTHLLNGDWPRLPVNAAFAGIIVFVILNRRTTTQNEGVSASISSTSSE